MRAGYIAKEATVYRNYCACSSPPLFLSDETCFTRRRGMSAPSLSIRPIEGTFFRMRARAWREIRIRYTRARTRNYWVRSVFRGQYTLRTRLVPACASVYILAKLSSPSASALCMEMCNAACLHHVLAVCLV